MSIFNKNNKGNKYSERKEIGNLVSGIGSSLKDTISSIPKLLENEKNKPKDERSKDLKALIYTIIIVAIIIFIFLKVPFLKKLLFP